MYDPSDSLVPDDWAGYRNVAAEFAISRERVRQIEARAFLKVQRAMQVAIADMRPSSALH